MLSQAGPKPPPTPLVFFSFSLKMHTNAYTHSCLCLPVVPRGRGFLFSWWEAGRGLVTEPVMWLKLHMLALHSGMCVRASVQLTAKSNGSVKFDLSRNVILLGKMSAYHLQTVRRIKITHVLFTERGLLTGLLAICTLIVFIYLLNEPQFIYLLGKILMFHRNEDIKLFLNLKCK